MWNLMHRSSQIKLFSILVIEYLLEFSFARTDPTLADACCFRVALGRIFGAWASESMALLDEDINYKSWFRYAYTQIIMSLS